MHSLTYFYMVSSSTNQRASHSDVAIDICSSWLQVCLLRWLNAWLSNRLTAWLLEFQLPVCVCCTARSEMSLARMSAHCVRWRAQIQHNTIILIVHKCMYVCDVSMCLVCEVKHIFERVANVSVFKVRESKALQAMYIWMCIACMW